MVGTLGYRETSETRCQWRSLGRTFFTRGQEGAQLSPLSLSIVPQQIACAIVRLTVHSKITRTAYERASRSDSGWFRGLGSKSLTPPCVLPGGVCNPSEVCLRRNLRGRSAGQAKVQELAASAIVGTNC